MLYYFAILSLFTSTIIIVLSSQLIENSQKYTNLKLIFFMNISTHFSVNVYTTTNIHLLITSILQYFTSSVFTSMVLSHNW